MKLQHYKKHNPLNYRGHVTIKLMQPQVPSPAPLPQPPNQTPPNKHPLYGSYEPKKRRWPVVVGICVIVLLLAGGILFFVVSDSDESDSGSSSSPSRPDYAERTPAEEADDDEVDWGVVDKYKAHIEATEASYDRMDKHSQDCNPEQVDAEIETLNEINLDYGAVAASIAFANEATNEHTALLDERYEAIDDRYDKMVADSEARYEAGVCEWVFGSSTL